MKILNKSHVQGSISPLKTGSTISILQLIERVLWAVCHKGHVKGMTLPG